MGRIAIEGMTFYAHHGYYHDERKLGNHFGVDVYVDTDFRQAAEEDALPRTVNYEEIWALAREVMDRRAYLIEHVAWNLYRAITDRFPQLSYCKVRITKHHPPLDGPVARTFVELDTHGVEGGGA
jgi:dihydroneopterin aldolase